MRDILFLSKYIMLVFMDYYIIATVELELSGKLCINYRNTAIIKTIKKLESLVLSGNKNNFSLRLLDIKY